jgi:hypothetical protein
MADAVIKFPPDSTDVSAKQVVFQKTQIPGVSGDVYFQYIRLAQPPTYIAVADNSTAAANKNHLTIFNKTNRRLRVEHIYAHVSTTNASGGNVVLQIGVLNAEPTAGTDITIRKFSSDFVDNPSAPNDVVAKTGATATPLAGWIMGGGVVNTNNGATVPADRRELFKKDQDYSSLQLLNGEGIVVRQTAGATAGSVSVYAIIALDT